MDSNRQDNWGRWGADDERGTLNLLTPERVLAATQVCKTGKVYSLSLPIQKHGVPILDHRGAPQRLSLISASDPDQFPGMGAAPGVGANEDVLVFASHSITHMDALSHVYTQDGIYNGFPRDEFSTQGGAPHCDIRATGTFAGRGILLDVAGHQGVDWLEPGHVIDRPQLEACAAAQGTEVRAGDILLVRTGLTGLPAAPVTGSAPTPRKNSWQPSAASSESFRCSMSVTPRFTSSSMWTARNTPLSNGMHSIAALSAPTAAIS